MNFHAVAQEFRDIEEMGRLAELKEAREVEQIAKHWSEKCSNRAIYAANSIRRSPPVDERDAIVILAALIAQLRKLNMHQEYRRGLVHDLALVVIGIDEELTAKEAAQ